MSFASICAAPVARIDSSTRWASTARSVSVTGRPWHAFLTPATIFSRENDSTTPFRLMTLRLAVSVVLNRRPHSGHCLRRRIASPSSLVRESITRVSGWRQNGQNIVAQEYSALAGHSVSAGWVATGDAASSANRAVTAAPCAGKSSASLRATMASCTSERAARS